MGGILGNHLARGFRTCSNAAGTLHFQPAVARGGVLRADVSVCIHQVFAFASQTRQENGSCHSAPPLRAPTSHLPWQHQAASTSVVNPVLACHGSFSSTSELCLWGGTCRRWSSARGATARQQRVHVSPPTPRLWRRRQPPRFSPYLETAKRYSRRSLAACQSWFCSTLLRQTSSTAQCLRAIAATVGAWPCIQLSLDVRERLRLRLPL